MVALWKVRFSCIMASVLMRFRGSRIEGVARQDFYELPVKTIRELISNAVCHRSYLTPGKIQVALFDDRLEVTSPGMLDSELTITQMKTGLSKIRNKAIAAAFSYMNIVEAWGSGIPKMFRDAKEYGLREPELIDMGSDFRVNLYRKEAVFDMNGVINPKMIAKENAAKATESLIDATNYETDATNAATNATNTATDFATIENDEEKILYFLKEKNDITQKELSEVTKISLGTVKRLLPKLQKEGKLERVGNRRSGYWKVLI